MAPRSDPAGLVLAAACAIAVPAPSPRLAAASTAAPPVASAACSSVRRSKRERSRPLIDPPHASSLTWPPGLIPALASTRPSHGLDEARIVVAHVTDARPDQVVHHRAARRRAQQRAQLLGVLVGRVEPDVE